MASKSGTRAETQTQDLGELLTELAIKIERLKQLYEQYFMGIEKLEPLVARKEVQRALLLLQQQYIRNTALRFKFNTMLQKWNIYVTHWNRVLREIENGTYVRHLARAKRAAERSGAALPEEMRRGKGMQALDPQPQPSQDRSGANASGASSDAPAAPSAPSRPGPPPLPPGAAPPRVAAASVPGMSEAELRALHQKYVDARKQSGEGGVVRYESLVSSLARQVPKVLERPGVKSVRFDVAIQDGKAVLKAIPSKQGG